MAKSLGSIREIGPGLGLELNIPKIEFFCPLE